MFTVTPAADIFSYRYYIVVTRTSKGDEVVEKKFEIPEVNPMRTFYASVSNPDKGLVLPSEEALLVEL